MSKWRVWLPVVLKGLGVVGILSLLAGIGSVSLLYGWNGVAVARGASVAPAASEWLAPSRPEQAAQEDTRSPDAGGVAPGGAGIGADGKVILNLASAEELRRLPGVGPRRAEAIVELRTRLKRFRRATDLLRVRGIGPRSLKRMQPHFVLDPAPSAEPADAGTRD
jgi:competence protein ComEA